MIRKQVYIEERQEALLKHRAQVLGVTEAELIRRGLDRTLAEGGAVSSVAAWQQALDVMHSRRHLAGTPRDWRRDDLYGRA